MIRRTLRVSPDLFVNMFMKEDLPKFYSITKDELPLDAKIVDVIPQWMGETEELATIDLVIESREFTEDTPEPLPPIEFTQVVAVINIDYLVTSKEEPSGKVQS